MQDFEGLTAFAGTRFHRPCSYRFGPSDPIAGQPSAAFQFRTSHWNRLRFDPPGGPGRRTFCRRLFRSQSDVLRSREHREARDRRWMQRGGIDSRGPRSCCAQVCTQDPIPDEGQPQRIPFISERIRSDSFCERETGIRHGRHRRRSHDLLRIRRVETADPGNYGHLPSGP